MTDAPVLRGLRGITFDFGNTLVRVSREAMRRVADRTAIEMAPRLGIEDRLAFRAAWAQERDRQFREEVPQLREVDLAQRVARTIARFRGLPPPPPDARWDDDAAAERSRAEEVHAVVETYSAAFLDVIEPVAGARQVLADLAARGFRVGLLSNWPLAETIDRYAAGAGWLPSLTGIFVSQRIGTIKPHPAIFAAAAEGLDCEPGTLLHVGDDWAADVVGARAAGWRAAYLRGQQGDTPLPTSARTEDAVADLELDTIIELAARVADPTP
ncbi:MAG: HAD family hydrolase [Candidatus Limnocylindrales bacterium]